MTTDNFVKTANKFAHSRYRLIDEIGAGGFATVYRGQDQETRQQVAIKLLTITEQFDALKKQRYIDRFHRETALVATLNHPNIVRLLDRGQLDGSSFYAVFELTEGQTLQQLLHQSGALSPIETGTIMTQVLDALSHAHNMGIIHRDIKPANIILDRTSIRTHVKILDFGIGALVGEARHIDYKSLTLTQETLGTPAYCAPEQLRGEPPTPKSDLYSWGLVLLECLTGQPAISGSSIASLFYKQLSANNIPLPAAIAGHPVAMLLRRVLQKQPTQRPNQASDIYREFSQLNMASLVGNFLPNVTPSLSSQVNDSTASLDLTITGSPLQTGSTERKHITAVCVRLTIKSHHSDPIDHEVANALHLDQKALCVDTCTRYGALHVGTLGDTLLFYFGYPRASDNDARLCARSALEFISLLHQRNALLRDLHGFDSEVHIGIHSDKMLTYADTMPEGDTANIAMELARMAQVNQILCSHSTKILVEHHIDFENIAELPFGIEQKNMPLYRMVGERLQEAFGFLRATQRHPFFVGRDRELGQLLQLVDAPTDAHFAHIFGEAGIGKSRLMFEFRNHTKAHQQCILQCLPEHQSHSLYPVIKLIKHIYDLEQIDSTKIHDTITRRVAPKIAAIDNALALVCTWLNCDSPTDCNTPVLSHEAIKQILFASFAELLFNLDHLAQNQKIFLIFEDIHWADPITVEFLHHVTQQAQQHHNSYVCISTSREPLPEYLSDLSCTQIPLYKLNEVAANDYISELFEHQVLDTKLSQLILDRTDGIPLFIEEFVNMLKRNEHVQRFNGIISFSKAEGPNEIPSSLRDSLQQNLDQLKSSKETAQLASAIGREFDYALLQKASRCDESNLQLALKELVEQGLVFVQRKVGGDTYVFKHALVRDAAYDSIPLSLRRELHRQIAQALEISFTPETGTTESASLLAKHWANAEEYAKAVAKGTFAAQIALRRSFAAEALLQAQEIEGWIEHLDDDHKIEAQLTNYGLYTSAYMVSKGWGSEEVRKYSQASIDLLASSTQYDDLVSHLWWKMINGIISGNRSELGVLNQTLEQLLEKISPLNQSAICCAQGFYFFTEGDRYRCIPKLERALQLYDDGADKIHQQVFGFDVGVFARATLARAYADQLRSEEALHLADTALANAKAFDHVPSIGIALMYHGLVNQQFGHRSSVQSTSSELVELAEKYQLPIYKNFGRMLHDWSTNNPAAGDSILATLNEAGSKHGLGHFQSFYAEMLAEKGEYEAALRKINECIALDRRINEPNYEVYLLLKKANILVAMEHADTDATLLTLAHAKELAHRQGVYFIRDKIKNLEASLDLDLIT